MQITLYDLAQRFVGLKEVRGVTDNPQILAMLRLDDPWPEHDEVPWCSAFLNYCCWLLRLPRSKSLAARSWLNVGRPISRQEAKAAFDIVVLSRPGRVPAGDPVRLPGHVGIFATYNATIIHGGEERITLLGGNQGDAVSIQEFDGNRVLGVRRLLDE